MALGKEAIEEFFDRIDKKPPGERDIFYNVIFRHMLYHMEDDGYTFVLKTRPDAFVYIPDFTDRILILKKLKNHFIRVEAYELIKGIDLLASIHQKMMDKGISRFDGNTS